MNIGITGHQDIGGKKLIGWLKAEISQELLHYPNIQSARSSLAVGADQLFAQIVLELKINLVSVIPSHGYENSFSTKLRVEYFRLKKLSTRIELLDFPSPSEDAFLAAGKHIAIHSDVIIAVWDGLPAKGLGGTGDIVEYVLSLGKKVIHLHTLEKKKYIYNG